MYDRYKNPRKFAEGGMSEILLARDATFERKVVLKTVKKKRHGDPIAYERLRREATIMARLNHPGVPPVYDMGAFDDPPWYAMQYIERGETLAQILQKHRERFGTSLAGLLNFRRIMGLLEVIGSVCETMAHAHRRGVVHRDLKPDNIMVGQYGEVYVIDWGLARRPDEGGVVADHDAVTVEGSIVGTWEYMAPEQARGFVQEVDARSDVFSVGCILYEIVTLVRPYHFEDRQDALRAAQDGVIEMPDHAPKPIVKILETALAPRKEDRYASMVEFASAIRSLTWGGWPDDLREYEAGEVIIHEGEAGKLGFIIEEGRAEAYRTRGGHEMLVEEMGPGDSFGELAIFARNERTATVRAVTRMRVSVINEEVLESWLGRNPFLERFVRQLAERFLEQQPPR